MRLFSIRLENIRSYTDELVEFPKGMTLLAGDVGSGKSTLLLAIEFALFGIQRGELSGAALLRHGAPQGGVALKFELNGNSITVARRLKRRNSAVTQESGSITIDGITTELSAQELKARILTLLNYPPTLLSKSKRPLWRYTVYTPQEEMKAILYERPEERVGTLRKLFDIDKYERVRENAVLLLREIKREETDLYARIEELEKEISSGVKVKERLTKTAKEVETLKKHIKELEKKFEKCQKELETVEKERFVLMEEQKRFAIAKSRVEALEKHEAEVLKDEVSVKSQLAEMKLKEIDEESLNERRSRLKSYEKKLVEKEDAAKVEIAKEKSRILEEKERAERIGSLKMCPTCNQPVDETHKKHIREEAATAISDSENRLARFRKLLDELEKRRSQYEEKRKELMEQERLLEANKLRQKLRIELLERQESIKKRKERLAKELEIAKQEVSELKKIKPFNEERFRDAKRSLEEARSSLEAERRALSAKEQEFSDLKKESERLSEQQRLLKKRQEALKDAKMKSSWIQKHLMNVSRFVEKALFSTIYGLFNEYFKEWFSLLMEEESITVRLDSGFTPVIMQDGYETSVEHLSGGEKTSVALAYRLSLNKAINEFLTGINTKGLLILDEPTDGFSSEQLDRVREVLERLKLEQLLIVSHEEQLEGYVDQVVRVQKRDNVSSVES